MKETNVPDDVVTFLDRNLTPEEYAVAMALHVVAPSDWFTEKCQAVALVADLAKQRYEIRKAD